MSPVDEDALEVEVRVEAPPETVFGFFTDPEKYRRWMGSSAALDPRPGGVYQVVVAGHSNTGRFVEVDPPRRIVFTWGWEDDPAVPPGSSTVEVSFEPDGDATVVRLRHTGLPSEDSRVQHEHGWRHFFSRLAVVAAGGDPGPDPMEPA